MSYLRHVIIGSGPAGVEAARSVRNLSERDEIALVTDEPHLSYSRPLLPDYVAGRVSLDRLWLHPESYYSDIRIEVRLETRIVSVNPDHNVVVTEAGEEMPFDRLLIACGGQPKLPSIEGLADAHAVTLKTLADAQNIIARAKRGSSVLVVARDLVGVEMTRAFCQMGMRVTYIEWGDELLPHLLDPATAEELVHKMKAAGVHVIVGEKIQRVEGSQGNVSVHTLGGTLTGDILAVAVGLTPALEWLKSSEIRTDAGVVADERLRTNYPNIFAAGDVAQVYDPGIERRRLLFGWKNAVEQGRIAGANMCGDSIEFAVTHAPGLKQIFGVDVRHRWK